MLGTATPVPADVQLNSAIKFEMVLRGTVKVGSGGLL